MQSPKLTRAENVLRCFSIVGCLAVVIGLTHHLVTSAGANLRNVLIVLALYLGACLGLLAKHPVGPALLLVSIVSIGNWLILSPAAYAVLVIPLYLFKAFTREDETEKPEEEANDTEESPEKLAKREAKRKRRWKLRVKRRTK